MQTIILSLIRLYRAVFSPWFGNQCRFYPTCSVYAEEAISAHGSVKGSWLALKRTGKCHPWNAGGIDLVPPNNKMKENHG